MSFAEIDEMELDALLDMIRVQNKIEEGKKPENKQYYIDDILPV